MPRPLGLQKGKRPKQQKPQVPNENCGLFLSSGKGFCYFQVDLWALVIDETVTNDWRYWHDRMLETARLFGCRVMRTWTVRHPLAYQRLTKAKLNPLLSGIDEDNQYKWCFEKDVKEWAEAVQK